MSKFGRLLGTVTRTFYEALSGPARRVRSFFVRLSTGGQDKKRRVDTPSRPPRQTPWSEFWSDVDPEDGADRLIAPTSSAKSPANASRPWYKSRDTPSGVEDPAPRAGDTVRETVESGDVSREVPAPKPAPFARDAPARAPDLSSASGTQLVPATTPEPLPASIEKTVRGDAKQRAAMRREAKRLRRLLAKIPATASWPELSDASPVAGLLSDMRSTVAAEAKAAFARAGGTSTGGFNTVAITRAAGAKRAVELVSLIRALSVTVRTDASEVDELLIEVARRGWLVPDGIGIRASDR